MTATPDHCTTLALTQLAAHSDWTPDLLVPMPCTHSDSRSNVPNNIHCHVIEQKSG